MIDLHCHSSFSDGELSPSRLLRLAARRGVRALALTDHDTTGGLAEFLGGGDPAVTPIAGVELAAMLGADTIHVVGLFIEAENPELEALLERVRGSRTERNEKILRRLRFLGCALDAASLRSSAGEGVVGRPHIALAMVDSGHCASMRQAFENYLGSRGKAYVKRFRPSSETAIAAVHAAGGVAVWAHPVGGRNLPESALRARMDSLKAQGLDAVESDYSDHSVEQRVQVAALAGQAGLLVSGGSDFHGATMPGIDLGVGRGDLAVPDQWLPPLRERAAEIRRR